MDKECFGELLVILRGKNQLSQKDLAQKLSVSTSAVSKWEHGHNFPDISMLIPLAEALNVSCEDLLYPEQTLADGRIFKKTLSARQKRFQKIAEYVLCALTILAVIWGGVFLYQYFHPSFERVDARFGSGGEYEYFYEISYVSSGSRDSRLLSKHLQSLEDNNIWETEELNPNIPIKITYYKNYKQAAAWERVGSYGFLVRR